MNQLSPNIIRKSGVNQPVHGFKTCGCAKLVLPKLLLLLLIGFIVTPIAKADEPPVFPRPIPQSLEGWTVQVDPELMKPENAELFQSAKTALANHLQRIKFILPDERVAELQKLAIRIDLNHPLETMQYHPSEGWLRSNGYDPALARHVHIPRAKALLDRQQWAKHPYVILHELAHAYHDQVLDFENAEIIDAFEAAKKEAIYDKVLSHSGRQVRHYALSNHKEYFAESTEAYLGVNDFYPFVRAELKQHDPRMYKLLEKIWGRLD